MDPEVPPLARDRKTAFRRSPGIGPEARVPSKLSRLEGAPEMDGWLPQGAFVQFLRRPSGQDGDKE